ncbi:MAG: lytic transglycosylase domain-containing protein [Proteobacteria bacterium]|nr:lytic transglycosylase domain-containing protein [Pseudomonadota bacterium]
MPRSPRTSRNSWLAEARRRLPVALVLMALSAAAPAIERGIIEPAAQTDPELRDVVQQAMQQRECFGDQYDSAVWYTLMEPKLKRYLRDHDERMALLHTIYCETHRAGVTSLPPGLVLAVLDVESHFDRWAVSSSGAVGLMQVMPFWPEQLGMQRRELVTMEANIRMGCAILRHYLATEHNDVRRALGRYNGSLRGREYPDRVVSRWTSYWNGADDLGRTGCCGK